MHYQVRFYVSTLYTSNFINSSIIYILTKHLYIQEIRKLIYDLFYIQETSYTQNGEQIMHNGEYQSR